MSAYFHKFTTPPLTKDKAMSRVPGLGKITWRIMTKKMRDHLEIAPKSRNSRLLSGGVWVHRGS